MPDGLSVRVTKPCSVFLLIDRQSLAVIIAASSARGTQWKSGLTAASGEACQKILTVLGTLSVDRVRPLVHRQRCDGAFDGPREVPLSGAFRWDTPHRCRLLSRRGWRLGWRWLLARPASRAPHLCYLGAD